MDLKRQKRIGILYSIGSMGTLVGELLGAYSLYYLTTVLLISPTLAAGFSSMSSIIGTISALAVGYVVTRYGLNRRNMAFGGFIAVIVLFNLYFAPFDFGTTGMTVYIGIIVVGIALVSSCFSIPFDTMAADLVTDSKVRTLFRTLCTVFIFVGIVFSNTLSAFIRAWLVAAGVGERMSWFLMAVIVSVVAILAMSSSWFASKGINDVPPRLNDESAQKKNILKSYLETLKVREVKTIFLWAGIYSIGNSFVAAMLLYFGRYVLGLSETAAATLFTISVIATLIASPLPMLVSGKLGKKNALLLVSFLYLFYIAYMLFTHQEGYVDGIIYTVAYSAMNIMASSLAASMVYDSIELVEFKAGQSKGTEILALRTIGMALGSALAAVIMGQVLSLGGFDGTLEVQSELTVNFLRYGCALVPAFSITVSAIVLHFGYKLNEKNHGKLVEALELRREGKEYSTEGFEELL